MEKINHRKKIKFTTKPKQLNFIISLQEIQDEK